MAGPGLSNAVINVAGVGAGLAQSTGLLSELQGQPTRVQFIKDGIGTVLMFDAVLSESHDLSSTPTTFPLEDGSVISDHIVQNPIMLTMTGVISDTPLPETLKDQLTETFGNAAASLLPPLGVTVASTAYSLYQTANLAAGNTVRRSQEAYNILLGLRAGNPNASPPTPPTPFTIMTRYGRYASMVITQLNFPVDASTDGQLVFTATLMKMTLVTPQVVNLATLSNSVLAANKVGAGEQEVVPSGLADGYKAEKATNFSKSANGYSATIEKGLGK